MPEYWEIYHAVTEILNGYGLTGTDTFIHECILRVRQNADVNWIEHDVRMAIRNQLNEMIEKLEPNEPIDTEQTDGVCGTV